MDDDERAPISRTAIERELAKAEQAHADARKAKEAGISRATIITRLYYACFHAAQAALYSRGFNPGSHGQVQRWLGRELIQSGDVSREIGRFLNDMETYRRRVEYGSGEVEREPEDLIRRTETFLDVMRELVESDFEQ